jgi:hypothetical protein
LAVLAVHTLGDQLGHVVVVGKLHLDPADLADGRRMQVVLQAPFPGQHRPASRPQVDYVGHPLAQLGFRGRLPVVEVKLREAECGQPVRPEPRVAAAKRHEDQCSPAFHAGQVRQPGLVGMEDHADPLEELDVVRSLHNDQDSGTVPETLGLRAADEPCPQPRAERHARILLQEWWGILNQRWSRRP